MSRERAADVNLMGVQPAWSQVTVEHTAGGFRMILPAVGPVRRRKETPWLPAQSLFWVSVSFCVITALLTLFFLALPQLAAQNTVGGKPVTYAPEDLVVPWPVWAGLVGFWGIALVGIFAGLNLCSRHGVIEIRNTVLCIDQVGLFGYRRREWSRDQIAAIQTGPTGLTIGGGTGTVGVAIPGGIRVAELHLYLKNGARVRLLAGRSEEELAWIAVQLRQALKVGTVEGVA
jgi:hypothetical protein